MDRFFKMSAGIVVLLVAATLLNGCKHRAASGLVSVKLQTDWYPQPEHGGFYTALVKGYYKDAGLDVQILPGSPYITGEQLVSAGSVQFSMGSSDRIIEAVAGGQRLLAVGATMQHDPQAVMVHAASPVHDFADLNGHAISVRPPATWFEYIVKRFGLKDVREVPATYSVANFIKDPQYIQQIFVTSEPYYVKKAGVPLRTLLISETGYDPYRVFFTSRDFAQTHPEVVAKFVQASIRGWHDYLQDPKPANDLIRKLNPAMDPELMQFSFEALRDGHFIDGSAPPGRIGAELGRFDPQRWAAMSRQLSELQLVNKPVDPSTVYTTQFQSK